MKLAAVDDLQASYLVFQKNAVKAPNRQYRTWHMVHCHFGDGQGDGGGQAHAEELIRGDRRQFRVLCFSPN